MIRCDDTEENQELEKRLMNEDWKFNLKFDYTGRDTPQQNHLAEVAFHTIDNHGWSLVNKYNTPKKDIYYGKMAFMTTTLLDGLVTTMIKNKNERKYVHWRRHNPELKKIKVWGETGVFKFKRHGNTKLDDRGLICMFIGYPASHSKDTFRMWDPKTRKVNVTCNIRWL
jgi:hypothetical protein